MPIVQKTSSGMRATLGRTCYRILTPAPRCRWNEFSAVALGACSAAESHNRSGSFTHPGPAPVLVRAMSFARQTPRLKGAAAKPP